MNRQPLAPSSAMAKSATVVALAEPAGQAVSATQDAAWTLLIASPASIPSLPARHPMRITVHTLQRQLAPPTVPFAHIEAWSWSEGARPRGAATLCSGSRLGEQCSPPVMNRVNSNPVTRLQVSKTPPATPWDTCGFARTEVSGCCIPAVDCPVFPHTTTHC